MFNDSLKDSLNEVQGIFTVWPHHLHDSLNSLFRRLNLLHKYSPEKAPTIFFIRKGKHEVGSGRILEITYPMIIIGAGREKTFIHGRGFHIKGKKQEGKKVVLKHMTSIGSTGSGLLNDNGLSFVCDSLSFTQCRDSGVVVQNTKGKLINCVITQCKDSGIHCGSNALITLEGSQTKVAGNCEDCDYFDYYGLDSCFSSSIIHLHHPLTKESVSVDNYDGQNYGGNGEISIVDNDGTVLERIQEVHEETESESLSDEENN
jgi:hypothetical protein